MNAVIFLLKLKSNQSTAKNAKKSKTSLFTTGSVDASNAEKCKKNALKNLNEKQKTNGNRRHQNQCKV